MVFLLLHRASLFVLVWIYYLDFHCILRFGSQFQMWNCPYTSSMNLFFFSFVFQLFVRSAMLLIDDSEFFAQQIIDNQFEFHFRPLIHSAYESKCVRWITAFIAADRSINHWFQYLVSVCEKFFPVSILALQIEAHNLTMRRKNFEVSYAIYLNRSVSSCICPRAPSLDRPKIGCVRSSL